MSPQLRDAIVHASPADAVRVAGIPLGVRTLLVLQRAGVERATVVGGAMPSDPRIRLAPSSAEPAGAHVVIGPGAIVDALLVRALVADDGPVRWERDGVWVERIAPGGSASRAESPPAGVLLPASAPRSEVETALLRGLENPRDGYLDRVLNRHLSRPTTRLVLPTPLTPNHVTILGVIVGIVGGLLLGSATVAGRLAGVAALVVSGVLDCVDGEIARIKFTESRIGHVLDITGDTLVHTALLAGIAMQLGRLGAWPGAPLLWLLGIGVVASFAAITWSEQTEARRHRVPDAWENRLIESVLSPLTTRDWYVFPVAFALAGRLDALVPAAAVGAQAFWITVVVLVVRVLRRM